MVHLPGQKFIGLTQSFPLNIALAAPGWARCALAIQDEGAIPGNVRPEARHPVVPHPFILPAGRLAMGQGLRTNPLIERLQRVILGAAPRGRVAA